jgi:hypothetical protein
MKDRIERAKNEFLQAKGGLLHALSTTPDDRLTWSPSPTSRSPLHQVVHAAHSIGNIHGFLDGRPFNVPTPDEADRGFRESEQAFTRREEAVSLLESNAKAFVEWLDNLDPERLGSMVETPFGMGPVPIELGITFPAMHTRWHHAQIDYIQTIYGDLNWHM